MRRDDNEGNRQKDSLRSTCFVYDYGYDVPWFEMQRKLSLPHNIILRMRVLDYLRYGDMYPGEWIIFFIIWARSIGFTVEFTQHDTKKQFGQSCGIVAAFNAHRLDTSKDFMSVLCDDAISNINTIAGYDSIGKLSMTIF